MKSRKTNSSMVSVIFAVVGLLLIIWPGASLQIACRIVGGGLITAAIACALFTWKTETNSSADRYLLWGACGIGFILGLLILAVPGMIRSFLPRLVGLILIINGAVNLMQTKELKTSSYDRWNLSLVFAVLTIVFGLIIFLNPFRTADILIRIIGIILVYNAATNFWVNSKFESDLKTTNF